MAQRTVTDEVMKRILKVDIELSAWMGENETCEIAPESCMEFLVGKKIYNYDRNNRGHYFREDLRTLRDNNRLDLFTNLSIEQKAPGSRWYIKLKNIS